MADKYETEKEAETKVKELNEVVPAGRCPLTWCICKPDCVCFEKARFTGQRKYKEGALVIEPPYYVYGSHCGNMMFFRECQNG